MKDLSVEISMISIIVPIYNIIDYLPKCMESICGQTYQEIEIILVDDGSTDGSAQICDKYAASDERIVVIHKKNGGLVSARKEGLRLAHGDYIGYVDGDDWIENRMYERMWKYAADTDVDIVVCGRYEDIGKASQVRTPGISEGYYGRQALETDIYPCMIMKGGLDEWGLFPVIWDKLWKRELLEKFQFSVDERITMGEDAVCVYPCLLQAQSIYVMHECLYHYRQTTGSMIKSVSDRGRAREQFRFLYETAWEQLKGYPASYNLREQWLMYMLTIMIPRAGVLYNGMDNLDFLFPFSEVGRGSKIVLYGAGTFGQYLHRYLYESGFCKVILWVDKRWGEYKGMGLEVSAPETIQNSVYDYIVVAIMGNVRMAVKEELSAKYGEDRVAILDGQVVMSDETFEAFGLV